MIIVNGILQMWNLIIRCKCIFEKSVAIDPVASIVGKLHYLINLNHPLKGKDICFKNL